MTTRSMGNVYGHIRENNAVRIDIPEWYITKNEHEPINVVDFWRRLLPEPHFCIVCVAVPHTQALEVPELVRRLFRFAPFRTQRQRLGTVVRASRLQVHVSTPPPQGFHPRA